MFNREKKLTRTLKGGGAAFELRLTGHWDSHGELDFRENGVFFHVSVRTGGKKVLFQAWPPWRVRRMGHGGQ
jgi:hypothetical protein